MTVPGIDVALAVSIVVAVGEFSRFEDPNRLVSYLGLNPRGRQSGNGPVARLGGQHLDNWNCCSAVNRSSISPSQDKDTIPIDPVRDWPPGQMLEGVKLQRARGGCLGAKSR